MVYDRDVMLKDLREMACEVHFKKVSTGDIRVMHASLRPDLLPDGVDTNYIKEQHEKEENKDVVVVWDLQKGGWRSFRVDSVIYFNALDNYD